MANDNVFTMKKNTGNTEEKVENFVSKYRNFLLGLIAVVVIAAIAVAVVIGVRESSKKKALAAIDKLEFEFINNSANLSDDEAQAREKDTLEALAVYAGRKDVAGVRANYLASEIAYLQKDYESVIKYSTQAALADKKAYTAPISYFNAASAAEEIENKEEALKLYESAASYKEFELRSHALFNVGRLYESLGNAEKALEAYQTVVDTFTGDEYANLAYSRISAINANK